MTDPNQDERSSHYASRLFWGLGQLLKGYTMSTSRSCHSFNQDNFVKEIKVLGQIIHRQAVEKGFWDSVRDVQTGEHRLERNIGEAIALCHSELSEALEGYRKGNKPDEHCPEFSTLEVELADCVIRMLDLAAGLNLRLPEAILAKHRYNNSRPYKHGKKF